MEVIRILETILVKSKQKEWKELAEKYGADELVIYKKGENLVVGMGEIKATYGYKLTWKTKEDHIHVMGDGANTRYQTIIVVDEPTYLPESLKKLDKAIKCMKEIEANRKKYYHKPVVRG